MSKPENDNELMAQVEWLASPEAGMKLPAEYVDPVACAIRLVYKQADEIERLKLEKAERERDDAYTNGYTDGCQFAAKEVERFRKTIWPEVVEAMRGQRNLPND